MSLIASENSGTTFDPIPEGTYLAVCYMMVDLGMQYSERWGRTSHKVQIGWELPELTVTIDGEEKPRTISKEYSMSLNKKGNLRQALVAWRGKDFTPEELERFDLRNIVGTSCLINIVQNDSNGKTYSNVSGIMALPKGMPKGKLASDPLIFDLDADDLSILNTFPKYLREKIERSETYQERVNQNQTPVLTVLNNEEDDDLPF